MGAIFDGVELATFLTWERWRWWRGVRDIWSARDNDARRHRRGLVLPADELVDPPLPHAVNPSSSTDVVTATRLPWRNRRSSGI